MLKPVFQYLSFWFKASDAHGIHSPFVFELYNQVIKADKEYYCFEILEELRTTLLKDHTLLAINDMGAGSKNIATSQRKISEIAKHSISKPKIAHLLFRLVDFFQPQTILELGTCLGITTLFLSEAAPKTARIYTFEGAEQLAQQASKFFAKDITKQTTHNIELILGNLDETLKRKVKELDKIDFVFFDANHQKIPTLDYFETCISKVHESSVFVFDDIYWSEDMIAAWQAIQAHPRVTLSIDLFHLGLVFFREKQPKQHFKLRF
ncbi:MAG: class I SAM-dependent methyltransferase [Thermoflexibacter sp.]|nr:class I SAM-dependent methyltransferase [Thermoflexibacter sp.]